MRVAELLRHPVIREWMFIFALLVVGCVCALRWEWFFRLDQTLYDEAIGLIQRDAQDDIIIVAVDEESLQKFGRFPWSRDVHATLLNKLTAEGARAIGFDIVLTERDLVDPKMDAMLGGAIRESGRVVLPIVKSMVDGAMTGEALPVEPFRSAAAGLAQIETALDLDGIARATYLRAGFGAARHPTLALGVLQLAYPEQWSRQRLLPGALDPRRTGKVDVLNPWRRDNLYQIPFRRSTRPFQTNFLLARPQREIPARFVQRKNGPRRCHGVRIAR